jgi:hypothetical protein
MILVRIFSPQKHLVSTYLFYDLLERRLINTFADEELTFIHPDDVELYNTWESRAFELQVASHELLGHGSGKLFQEDATGKKNFNRDKVHSYHARQDIH